MRGYTLLRNVWFLKGNCVPDGFYRFEAKIISRTGGRSSVAAAAYRTGGKSVVAAAAYRSGAELVDERTGKAHDYSRKTGIRGSEIMLPAGAPAWMADRQHLWNAVEKAEKRKDAQLARDYILSLPKELSPQERRALTKWFVSQQFTSKGYVADVAWHSPERNGGLNHHAHVMVTMRRVGGDGFARTKDRAPPGKHPMNAWKDDLLRIRKEWADAANRFLEAAGLDVRISHESLKTRGIDDEPDPKLGPVAMLMEANGLESHAGNDRRDVAARNAERAQLKTEMAAVVAEEAQIIQLLAERRRREAMDEREIDATAKEMPELIEAATEQIRKKEREAKEALARDAQSTVERIATFKTETERAEARAKRLYEQQLEAEEQRRREGAISSAEARYSIALGDTASSDPFTNLVRAAGAESAAFLRNQEKMRADLANLSLTAEQKRETQLRKDIEFYEYSALTNTRLAGLYEVIGGNAHLVQAGHRGLLATEQSEKAKALREERSRLLDAERRRESEEISAKVRDFARTVDQEPLTRRGINVPPEAQRDAQQQTASGGQVSETGAEGSSAAREKEAKLRELDNSRSRYQEARNRARGGQDDETTRHEFRPSDSTDDRKRGEESEQARASSAGGKDGPEKVMSDDKQLKLARLEASHQRYQEAEAQRRREREQGRSRGRGGR